VITGPQYDAITAELVVHSNEEHAHAISLSDQIDFLGGIPAVDVGDIHISPDSKIMLELDLEGELDAIARYKERVAQAEMLQEYGLRRALEDILIVEEEHARDLQSALTSEPRLGPGHFRRGHESGVAAACLRTGSGRVRRCNAQRSYPYRSFTCASIFVISGVSKTVKPSLR